MLRAFLLLVALFATTAAAAPLKQSEALAADARYYAAQHQVSETEAVRRLRIQQASVTATEAIAAEFAGRLAGISIEHSPDYWIAVLLTGTDSVPNRLLKLAGTEVVVAFRTGARATRAQAVDALRKHLIDLRTELPGARGAGYDQRTGEIVLLVPSADAARFGLDAIRKRAEQVGGVPVRVVVNELLESNMLMAGGGRVDGISTTTGRRNICTTAFVVTDGTRRGIATAAHCPDQLTYRDPQNGDSTLEFAGQWGLGYHDVQVNLTDLATKPIFYSDRKTGEVRELTSWRNRDSTRAGDFVCHYGETTGTSCAEVELTDYAPPGALCGGPCWPSWVTVRGPGCAPGDSGGPVFSGTVAFGIAKGINRASGGRCNFYYYMSTDYLPPPWSLLTAKREEQSP